MRNSVARPICLVLMPMVDGYEGIRAVVANAISRAGAEMCRLEEVLPDAYWQHWLVKSVSCADFFLADVTDHNPYVMYEVGVAHQQRLPCGVIVNAANERITPTLLGSPFLPYNEGSLGAFEGSLAALLAEVIGNLGGNRTTPQGGGVVQRGSEYYEQATRLLAMFSASQGAALNAVSHGEFVTRLSVAEHRGDQLASSGSQRQWARSLLARVIVNSDEIPIMQAIDSWVRTSYRES